MLCRRILRPTGIIVLLSFVPAACGIQPVALRSVDELASQPDNDKSAVLFQLTAAVAGRPATVYLESHPPAGITASRNEVIGVRLKLASKVDNMPVGLFPTPTAVDFSADYEGWRYLLLPAGEYLLTLTGSQPKHRLRTSFKVPNEVSVLYIGSFHLSCDKPGRTEDCAPELRHTRNITAAKKTAGRVLETPLAVAQTRPLDQSLAIAAFRDHAPDIMVASTFDALQPPDWSRFSEESTPKAPKSKAPKSWSGGGGFSCGGSGGLACVALLTFILAAWGTYKIGETTVEAIQSATDANRWTPCVEKLSKTLNAMDLEGNLQKLLAARFPTRMTGAITDKLDLNRPILTAKLSRVSFRKCYAPNSHCIEITIETEVKRPSDGVVLGQAAYIYTNVETQVESRKNSYTKLAGQSECREMKDYCDEGGTKLFATEINKAMTIAARQLADDLGFK